MVCLKIRKGRGRRRCHFEENGEFGCAFELVLLRIKRASWVRVYSRVLRVNLKRASCAFRFAPLRLYGASGALRKPHSTRRLFAQRIG